MTQRQQQQQHHSEDVNAKALERLLNEMQYLRRKNEEKKVEMELLEDEMAAMMRKSRRQPPYSTVVETSVDHRYRPRESSIIIRSNRRGSARVVRRRTGSSSSSTGAGKRASCVLRRVSAGTVATGAGSTRSRTRRFSDGASVAEESGVGDNYLSEEEQFPNNPSSQKDEEAIVEEEYEWVEEEFYELPKDVFTMMFFAGIASRPFLYGLFVYTFQIVILSVITFDLLQDTHLRLGEDDHNNFNVPVMINDWQVRATQIMSIFISVASRDDCTDTFNIVWVGFKRRWTRIFPGATAAQFVLMNVLRFSQGAFVIVVSFIYILQSDNVLDLFMNFAAMQFVSALDNLAYEIAAQGWVSNNLKQLTSDIEEKAKIILNGRDKAKLESHPFLKHFLFFVFLVTMYIGLVVNLYKEREGILLKEITCADVDVRFGDKVFSFGNVPTFKGFEFENENTCTDGQVCYLKDSLRPLTNRFNTSHPEDLQYEFFSGLYKATFFERRSKRPIYYQEELEDPTSGKFYYCAGEKAWVFTVEALARAGALLPLTQSRCGEDGWLAISPVTTALSLDEAPTEGWKIWGVGTLENLEDFSIRCAECYSDIDCGLTRGSCVKKFCMCRPGYLGHFCEEEDGCGLLAYYARGRAEVLRGTGLGAYKRPIYTRLSSPFNEVAGAAKPPRRPGSSGDVPQARPPQPGIPDGYYNPTVGGDDEYDDGTVLLMLYTGKRWYLTLYQEHELTRFLAALNSTSPEDTQTFGRNFHAYWNHVFVHDTIAISEKTTRVSPTGPLVWTQLLSSHANGAYDVFGPTKDTTRIKFECLSVDCRVDNICGREGQCEQVSNIAIFGGQVATGYAGGQCNCSGTHTGHYCEYGNFIHFDDQNRIIAGPYEVDPFRAQCAGPHANLTDCESIFFPN